MEKLSIKPGSNQRKTYWRLTNIHRPGPSPDIVIFTPGRSGGTWLMELIAYCPKIRPVSEPFSLSLIQHPRKADFAGIDPSCGYPFTSIPTSIQQYIADMLSGRISLYPPLKNLRKNPATFHWITNRSVIKISHGKGLIGFFRQHFDVQCLYFFREPLATIRSMMRRGFNTKYHGFLADQDFVQTYLNGGQIELANRIDVEGRPLEKFALSWALENLQPHRLLQTDSTLPVLSFEELVAGADAGVNWLAETFSLPSRPMQKRFHRASSTADRKPPTAQQVKEKSADIDLVYRVLDAYGIDFYLPGAPKPQSRYLIGL